MTPSIFIFQSSDIHLPIPEYELTTPHSRRNRPSSLRPPNPRSRTRRLQTQPQTPRFRRHRRALLPNVNPQRIPQPRTRHTLLPTPTNTILHPRRHQPRDLRARDNHHAGDHDGEHGHALFLGLDDAYI